MPVLSINYGLSNITGLYLSSKGELQSIYFGYAYSKDLYSHFYSEESFNHDVASFFIKELKIPEAELTVITTGLSQPKTSSSDKQIFISWQDLFKKNSKYNLFYADKTAIFTKNSLFSLYDNQNGHLSQKDKDFQANQLVYQNISPTNFSQYNTMLSNIWSLGDCINKGSTGFLYDISKPVLFFGDVFRINNPKFIDLIYLYIMSILSSPGVFNILLDQSDIYVHYLNIYDYSAENMKLLDNFEPVNLGTLVNSPGSMSCLIETEVGTQQFIELTEGKIFVVPLDKTTKATIKLKNDVLGYTEKEINGGRLGLVFDTRLKNTDNYKLEQLDRDIENTLKFFDQAVERL